MPQLQQIDSFASQIFWLFVCLGIVYFYMAKFAVPKMAKILSIRDTEITGSLNEAESLRGKAAEDNTGYLKLFNDSRAQAQAIVSEATKQANSAYEQGLHETEQKLKKDIEIAEKDINLEVKKLSDDVSKNLTVYVEEVVKKLSGANPDKASIDKIISKLSQ